jgi:hypothetical protein
MFVASSGVCTARPDRNSTECDKFWGRNSQRRGIIFMACRRAAGANPSINPD